MICTCESCGFIFCRSSEELKCPLCDQQRIRYATADEEDTFRQRLIEKNLGKILMAKKD